MNKTIDYIDHSNNNRYTFRFYKNQLLVKEYTNSSDNHSCLGGITLQVTVNTFDKAIINLYTTTERSGNNHLIFNEEEIKYYMDYLHSLFPIFTWSLESSYPGSKIRYFKLIFYFDDLATQAECNQIKMLMNLIRRLYECPRNYQLKHTIELFKKGWHNLSIHQIMLLAELTEYQSTNDHKLINFYPTALLTDNEFIKRVSNISGIYNANRLEVELQRSSCLFNMRYNTDYQRYPVDLTDELLQCYENLFNLSNKWRKYLKLNEL